MHLPSRLFACLISVLVLPAWADGTCAPPPSAKMEAGKNPKAAEALKKISPDVCEKSKLAAGPDGNPSIFDVLKLAMADEPRPRGDRLKPAAPAGMPNGMVLPENGNIVFDANAVAAEGIVSLDIVGPQFSQRVTAASTQIASSQFRPGAEYRWTLTTRRQSYDATFTLADAEATARVNARLQSVSALALDDTARLILQAAIYDDEEFYASRDKVIGALRQRLH